MSPSQPFFIYGALRSGTTLLRLLLKSHSGIQSPGEADYLFDYIAPDPAGPGGWLYDTEALGRERVFRGMGISLPEGVQGVDLAQAIVRELAAKSPGLMALNIHRKAPVMAQLFPQSKIIHLLRDPRDVALSAVGMGWCGNSFFGVNHWIDAEQPWDAASIADDRVLTVTFEALLADVETELTRICDFLGLPFDPEMLNYHRTSNYGPLNPKVAGGWRQKAGRREIARIEARLGPLLEARGYAPTTNPVVPGALERRALSIENDLKRWRYNIRRYGLGLFAGHHAARLLGLGKVARKLADRQEAIRIANLK